MIKTGEEISLILTPNEGYEIKSITINDVEQDVNITNYTYTVLDDNI